MAERNSWAVNDTGGVLGVEDGRLMAGALLAPGGSNFAAKTGLRPGPSNPGAVTASGTPDGNVHVAPFQMFMQTGRASGGGCYVATLDADKVVNILATPANATNPRNDLIVAQQSDKWYLDGSNAFQVRQVVGTPAGSPVDPAVTGSPDYVTLARVRVDANATSISGAKITDLRPSATWTVALGGLLPVPSATARDSLAGLYEGYPIWRNTRDWVEVYDGAAWKVIAPPVVSSSADLTAISSPYDGLIASGTDGQIYRRESGAWKGLFEWQDFTPAVYQAMATTPASVSATKVYAKYRQVGKFVWAHAEMTLGASTSGGCGISLPVAASQRLFSIGTLGLFGASTPADQSGHATVGVTSAPFDKLVVTAYSNGYREGTNGHSLRYNVYYEAA